MFSRRVVVPPGLSAELACLARASLPHEACGLLIGRRGPEGTVVDYATRADNAARSATRFELDPMHVVEQDGRARALGRSIVAVWHSHVDTPPVPSAADRAGAANEWLTAIVSLAGAEPELRFWETA